MRFQARRGFTLIELLTVIAIIMILMGLVVIGMGRFIERAKIAAASNTMNQIRNSMTLYFTKNVESYPPAYGYLTSASPEVFCLEPYTVRVGLFGNEDFYDSFSESLDTNMDDFIDLPEYCPPATKTGLDKYTFPSDMYWLSGPNVMSTRDRIPQGPRPYAYFPINRKQFKRVHDYYYAILTDPEHPEHAEDGAYARTWPPDNLGLFFPPPKYDAFVLIGVGPMNHTAGVIPATRLADGSEPQPEFVQYHVTALRAFYLATRDLNENMRPDFDFRNRTGQGEDAEPETYEAKGINGDFAQLPAQYDRVAEWATLEGPLIFVYGM
ncbi:MAG TPA: type II secretion system protein [Candidatus Hydrogenedentes bacterium]|nr:type II secretion system protein [Candidatus Hydrogenedentota bacterium]HPG69715.1 type II secretion system protein [Candidatus Hydrogenedentota bacterium]